MAERRFVLEPDPAWDWYDDQDGVLTVELSWMPDALAGRLTELVVSPELAGALAAGGVTGFTVGIAVGFFAERGALDVLPGELPPDLVRLCVGDDLSADLAYLPGIGLTASQRVLDLFKAHCRHLDVTELSRGQ